MKQIRFLLLAGCIIAPSMLLGQIKLGIDGLSHSHVILLLRRPDMGDIEIVGIAEKDTALVSRLSKQFGFSKDIVYPTLEEMVKARKPEAVAAFNSIHDHLSTVEVCAPKGIHVMVEKPLAVSEEHGVKMIDLAQKHNIHLITNYETTWYASNHAAYDYLKDGKLGDVRKVLINDGHMGPKEIRVNQEFLDWLTDPILNGGGAVTDFGCYGANIMTWLMDGQLPKSVTAILATNKPDVYPKVDDEATIVLQYEKTQCVIQASWNWPFSRKDVEVYGTTGYIKAIDPSEIRYRLSRRDPEKMEKLPGRTSPHDDPFSYLAAIISGRVELQNTDLSSTDNNLKVIQILTAAKQSAVTGKTVFLEAK